MRYHQLKFSAPVHSGGAWPFRRNRELPLYRCPVCAANPVPDGETHDDPRTSTTTRKRQCFGLVS